MAYLVLLLSALILSPHALFAEDAAPKKSASTYLEELQAKLDHVARRANQPTSTGSSVAGLRGSKQEPTSKQLYWKGKESDSNVTIEEVRVFRKAVEEARAGQVDNARKTLASLLTQYPQSRLKPDAEETMRMLDLIQ